jgi:CDP-diacylglycerol--glycerol-3-phosphate 3-phosphatidyltransferase
MERKVYDSFKTVYTYALNPILQICIRANFHTNIFSFLVFFFTGLFVFFLLTSQIPRAGAAGFIVALCDILGSLIAEVKDPLSSKRALLDSIIDRYSEILLYTGVIVLFLQAEEYLFVLFAYLSLVGALMSSFIRLRAVHFGIDADFGFIQRPERIFILSIGMFFGIEGAGFASMLVAIISNVTASYLISRIWFYKEHN